MSLAIAVYVPEGIVLAADSRLTLVYKTTEGNITYNNKVVATDSLNKVFLLRNKFGLAAYGTASIKGIPIAGYISKFAEEKVNEQTEVDEVPNILLSYFGKPFGFPGTSFLVAGYKIEDGISMPHVYNVSIADKSIARSNRPGSEVGARWGGETEIMTRLTKGVYIMNEGKKIQEFPDAPIPFPMFTLQDAIDFSIFAIRTTMEAFRFQKRPKTVGGPIDILVLKPQENPIWVARKEYRADY